jgi:hypothetical protein
VPDATTPRPGSERGEIIRQDLQFHDKAMGRKPSVRVCAVSCLDLCAHGPEHPRAARRYPLRKMNRAGARAVYDGEVGGDPTRPDLELELT